MGTSCWVSNKHAAVLATCSAQLVQFSPQPPRSQLTIPTQPSTLALATRPAHRPTAVLLTQVMLGSKLATEARAALEDEGVAVIATPILRREHVRQAFASVPHDLVGYDDVLGDLLAAIAEEVPA